MQCDRQPAFGGRPAVDITGPTDFPPGRHPSLTSMSGSAILAIVAHERFLTARIDVAGGPEIGADRTRVPWWSFTKTALATAALQLVARGQCRLDARIDGRPYTLRQLLHHRAGVPNYGNLACYHEAVRRGEKPWTVGQMLERVGADRLDFDPGKGWRYSNVGYFLPPAHRADDRPGHRQCLAGSRFRSPRSRFGQAGNERSGSRRYRVGQ